MNIYLIHLCYYAKHHDQTKKFIETIQREFDLPNENILCIINNDNYPDKMPYPRIQGDNTLWEFSGWNKGLTHLKSTKQITDTDVIIISNDTANTHRYFGKLSYKIFFDGIHQATKHTQDPWLVGERRDLKLNASLLSNPIHQWVSTYFFAMNGQLANHLPAMHIGREEANTVITEATREKLYFSDALSANLANYINNWLFPAEGKKGWYRAVKNDGDIQIIKNKALSIINEKWLSSICESTGGKLINVYDSWWKKKVRRLARKKYKKGIKS